MPVKGVEFLRNNVPHPAHRTGHQCRLVACQLPLYAVRPERVGIVPGTGIKAVLHIGLDLGAEQTAPGNDDRKPDAVFEIGEVLNAVLVIGIVTVQSQAEHYRGGQDREGGRPNGLDERPGRRGAAHRRMQIQTRKAASGVV